MNLNINPTNLLQGEIKAPPSKSYSHRAFLVASLANGQSIIKNPLTSGDVKITLDGLRSFGVKIDKLEENYYKVENKTKLLKQKEFLLDCKNSGSSIRFFSALSLLIDGGVTITGEFFVRNRPILPLLNSLKNFGAIYDISNNTLHIERKEEKCNITHIPGHISSQFISALLMISPIIPCGNSNYVEINVETPLSSHPYIEITLDVLNSFGVQVEEILNEDNTANYHISNPQRMQATEFTVPGDFSSIAFIIAAVLTSPADSHVIIKNLDFEKPQGDKRFIKILQEMGADIEINGTQGSLTVRGSLNKNVLKGIEIDCNGIPDLFPILCIIGAFATSKTILYNISTLKYKESDRIKVMMRELKKMGVKVEYNEENLVIHHCNNLEGTTIDHENDHRIAMAFTIAALHARSRSRIKNAEIFQDSYPDFIQDMIGLGAKLDIE
ncbi:MAG: 3-phosphoshikimate 1-carboxyvinyltransferase [Candidatus Lokiarchaeota archaeon]|nr:3-phosphoshikimate 1-carboxyvinyltransferase [Candidatus Lokiarchaeota archaeon]